MFGKTRVAAGIVGHADMMLGGRVEPVLTALIRAGGDRFRGIRHGVSWEAESYPVFWNACKLMAKGASSSEKADLFAGSAARCYRLNGLA